MTLIVQKTCHDSAVSRSHLTAESLVQSQISPRANCSGKIGTGTDCLRAVRFSPLSIFPPLPMLILIKILFLLRQAGEFRQTSKNAIFFFRISKSTEKKVKNAMYF
jgi:hypothetical protein